MLKRDSCGKEYASPSDGVLGDGDFTCGECVAAYLERTGQIPADEPDSTDERK